MTIPNRQEYLILFLRGCAEAADQGQLGVEMSKLLVNGDLMREAADEFEKRLPKVPVDEFEEFLDNIQNAERSAQRALNMLYPIDTGVRRGMAYRIRLGKAQSILMTLLVREINRKDNRLTDGAHDWENIGRDMYECVYCERKTPGRIIAGKTVYMPDVLRRIPGYGRRHRCQA